MVVSSFLLCDQLSGLNLHCSCASAGFYLFFHTIKLVVKICQTNDVYFYRAMPRKSQYCCWTSFVSPSVCNVAVFIVLWAYVY